MSFENIIPYPADTVWNVIRQAEYFPRWFHIHENNGGDYSKHYSKCIMDKFSAGSGFILFEDKDSISVKDKYPEFITNRAIVDYREGDYVVIKLPDMYRDMYLKLSVHAYERYTTKIKAEITKYYIPPRFAVIINSVFSSFLKKPNEEERIYDAPKLENEFKRMVKEITAICYDLDHPQTNMSDCYWFTSMDNETGTIHFYPNKDGRKVPYVGHYIKAKERICYVKLPPGTRIYERGEYFIVDEEYSKEKYYMYSEESGYIANILKNDGDSLSTKYERIFLVCKTLDALKRVTGDENIEHDKI